MTRQIAFGSPEAPPLPSKIVAVGKNYREHAAEFGSVAPEDEPMLFLKAPSALVVGRRRHRAAARVAARGLRGRARARHRQEDQELAAGALARGARRRLLRQRRHRARSPEEGQAVRALEVLRHVLPGRPRDRRRASTPRTSRSRPASTAPCGSPRAPPSMVFSPAFLVAYVSRMMTLLPGDLILTGTPAGVGPLSAGDVVEVEIEGSACCATASRSESSRPGPRRRRP